ARSLRGGFLSGYALSDLRAAVRYHFYLIGAIAVAAGLGLFALTQLGVAGFTAHTLLFLATPSPSVERDAPDRASSVLEQQNSSAVRANISQLRSASVLSQVVAQIGPEILFPELAYYRILSALIPPWRLPEASIATQLLTARLRTEVIPQSAILSVSFAHADQTVALHVVNAITAAYMAHVRSSDQQMRIRQLVHQLDDNARYQHAIKEQMQQVRKDHNISNLAEEMTVALARLDDLIARDSTVRENRRVVQAELS